jgi:hypothetical protein
MKRWMAVTALAIGLLGTASAQCVMCYTTARAQQAARSRVLNMGILLLGAPPFLILAGFIAFVFSRADQTRDEGTDRVESTASRAADATRDE